MSDSIERELERCKQSAEEDYELANAKYSDIKNTLIDAAKTLSKTDAEQSQVQRIQNTKLVEEQKSELQRLRNRIDYIGADLQSLRGLMKDFSIVVYGRTEAGKSTLMEILTHGDGKSIGKGGQRTTLDVRDYYWNGLKITDVPGISAFGGEADERLALKAAKSADLILFLLTDDAPQADEAAKLAQLKKFGKPILGLINVKSSFSMSRRAISLRKLQQKLGDTNKIEAILNQFKAYDKSYNQDWSGIKFVATHLLSAYQAHPCRNDDAEIFAASQFSEVEDFILEKVRNDGRFLRIKTFADSIAVPMSNVILEIYKQSADSLLESDVWFDKRRQLDEWREKFVARSQEKLDNLYQQLSNELDSAIGDFSYYHYEDKNAGANWQSRFKSLKFDEKYQEFLKSLADECERKRRELSDELTQELSYTLNNNARVNIQLDSTTPWGQYISTAIGLAGFAFPPLRIASFAIGILGNLFFDSEAKQRAQNRQKLRDAITGPSYDVINKMHDQVINTLNSKILNEGVDKFHDLLCGYQFMLARLGESQYYMANTLFGEFSDLNFKLLVEASNYKGAGSAKGVSAIPRIPGETMIIFADSWNVDTKKLSDLLGEKVLIMKDEENIADNVKHLLNCDFDVDYYPLDFTKDNEESKNALAIFPKNKVNATAFKLAQQMAGVPIIAEFNQPQSSTQSTRRNNQTNTSTSGGRQQIDAFDSDFKRIDSMFANCATNFAIRNALDALRRRAKNLRDAKAMRKIADYYDKVCDSGTAYACRREANYF